MVSFQCDACSDVVKKPKLEQHYGRCGAPVSCIDCSKTFYSPAEFKSHTSCISEAEKYEKSVYQGPKSNSQSRSFDMGRFGSGGFGGGRGGRPPRAFGTGGNDIALGANAKSFSAPSKSVVEQIDEVASTPVPNGDAVKLSKKERKQAKYKAKEESLTVDANGTTPPELTAASISNGNSEEPKKPKSAPLADPGGESGIKVDADGAKKKSKKLKNASR
ncbi:hypothetical protein BS47DRAFT_223033 [Hydnum rufescens UP504]|uniref:Zinc finger C2H2 LYAR-type domain-containing protein n=1 Tax=Hydnum rufescens UP504 TaxID=1448309 RepID=A0A9P6DXM4_9AGAM|nr:hypothetical protein BS47DRAFT_223033 [Hydnum rufescens UP504]